MKEQWPNPNVIDKELLEALPTRTLTGIRRKAHMLNLPRRKPAQSRFISSYVHKRTLPDLSYESKIRLAAFIDGEGTITVSFVNRRNGVMAPHVEICGTNEDLLKWLRPQLRGCYLLRVDNYPQRKPVWRVVMVKVLDVKALLEQILPFLIVKKRQAELLLEYCNLRLKDKAREKNPRLFEIAKEIRRLNHRGKPITLGEPAEIGDPDGEHGGD